MSNHSCKMRCGIEAISYVIFAFFTVPHAAVGAPKIASVNLTRTPGIVSTNSFCSSFLDQPYGLKVSNVYATITVMNDEATDFHGFLEYQVGLWGDESLPVDCTAHESKDFVMMLPYSPLTVRLKTGYWAWEQYTVDSTTITIEVRDTTTPTFAGPPVDDPGYTVLFSTAAERDTAETTDVLFNLTNLFCIFASGGDECFPGAGEGSIINTSIKNNIRNTAEIQILGGDLYSGNYYRDIKIRWRNKSSHIETTGGPHEFLVYYDRAVITLELPQDVDFISATPEPTILPYVNNGKRFMVWIVNGVDKLIVPSSVSNEIDVTVSEPYSYTYKATANLMLQIGPFADKEELSDPWNKPPKYDYAKWEANPSEVVWLTVVSPIQTSPLFSSRPEDLGYNPLYRGFPYQIVCDYGAMCQIDFDYYLNNNLLPEYLSELTFTPNGNVNIEVEIDQENRTAAIVLPSDWHGEEAIHFMVADTQGRTDTLSTWINSIIPTFLETGGVTPALGTIDDVYTFSVVYMNPDNIYPKQSLCILNGISHNMKMKSESPSVKDGAIFEYTGKLSTTNNHFYFEFGDEAAKFRFPQTGYIDGPDIAKVHDIAIRNFNIYPETPGANDLVEVQAQIENLGTQWEPNIPIVFKVNNAKRDRKLISVSVEETSPVIVFSYQIPISDYTEYYELKIEAGPVSGETGENVESVVLTIEPKPGAISGWVFDQWNNPIEEAVVKVSDPTAKDFGSTTSDSDGYYYLDGLKPTPEPEDYYTLEAYKEGVGNQTKTGVEVHSMEITEGKNFNIMEVQWAQLTSGDYYEEDTFWSPSGDKVVFTRIVDNVRTIMLMNQDGSGLKPMSEGRRPAWSPNGTSILFDEGGNIWVMSAAGTGSDAHMLIDSADCGTWSPDSRRIAFSNWKSPAHGQIYIYNLDTSTSTQVTPSGEYRDLAWSPDGKSIAFSDNFGRLGIANIITGQTSLVGMNGNHPSWLSDSTGFLFSSSQYDIWLYRINTEEFIKVTFTPEYDEDPSIPLQNPSKIAFTSKRGIVNYGKNAVFKTDFSAPRLYFTEIAATPSIFTPNGDGVDDEFNLSYKISEDAYVTVKIYDSLGNYVRTLLGNTLQMAGSYSDCWDGKNQEGNRDNDEVYFYTLDMHDADEVAIPAYGRVGMHKNIRDIPGGAACPRWSHSGDKILYTKEEYDPVLQDNVNHIYICDANDFSNKQLIQTPFKVRRKTDWSRDDNQIVFTSIKADNEYIIAKIDIDGTGYTEITTRTLGSLIGGDYPAWSPTEDKIVLSGVWNEPYVNNFIYITTINSDGSGLTKVGGYKGISPPWPNTPAWSPDGSKIAYPGDRNEDKNFEIYLMNADGSGEQKITNNPYMDGYPEFTPDGKRILFGSTRQGLGGLWTQPLDGSDKPRFLSKGFGYGTPSLLGDKILVQNSVLELFLSLTKGAIEGKVLEHETLAPIEDANVYVSQGSLVIGTTVTNEQGGYQFYNLEPGDYVLNAEAEGYVESNDVKVETYAWVVSRDNDIELQCVPSVSVSEISDGQVIGSVIAINAKREEGNVAYVKYQYRSQGGEWQDIETTLYPYPAVFDTREPNLSSGIYQIRALAQDALGNGDSSPSTIDVEIDHTAPAAKITSPISGTAFTGAINIRAYCSDPDTDSVLFQYRRKGDVLWINIGSVDIDTPWERTWKTDHLIGGEYELRAMGIDRLGNSDDNPEILTVIVRSNPADLNSNGIVDFGDLAQLVGFWLTDDPTSDIAPPGGDGKVNLLDFALFAENWLEATTP